MAIQPAMVIVMIAIPTNILPIQMEMVLVLVQEIVMTKTHTYTGTPLDNSSACEMWMVMVGHINAPRRGKEPIAMTLASMDNSDEDNDGQDSCDGDCDDTNIDVYDGAASREEGCMFDGDGDGWGDPNAPEYGISGSDCDDNDASLNRTDRDGDGFTT